MNDEPIGRGSSEPGGIFWSRCRDVHPASRRAVRVHAVELWVAAVKVLGAIVEPVTWPGAHAVLDRIADVCRLSGLGAVPTRKGWLVLLDEGERGDGVARFVEDVVGVHVEMRLAQNAARSAQASATKGVHDVILHLL